jgi:hypothetical protein
MARGVPEPVELFKTFEIKSEYTFCATGVVRWEVDGDGGCETAVGEMAFCGCETLRKLVNLLAL